MAAAGRSDELAASAENGIVVARVDGVQRDDLKEMAMALRTQDGVDVAILGAALDGGGAALLAAVSDGAPYNAAELIADAARAIKGGGGKGEAFAMAGGKDGGAIDEALNLARQAAGLQPGR
jgi:alanyl-tRNA synthetase